MTIPTPRKLRSFDFTEPQCKVWGLVRSCITRKNVSSPDIYAVGTAFIGKHPPKNYFNDPAMLFDISQRSDGSMWQVVNTQNNPDESRLSKELRRHSRYSIPANVIVEIVDSEGNVQASEPTFTENLSLSGAALFTTFAAEVGSFVRVKCEQDNVSIIAVVRGRHNSQDGIPRLHIEFVDRFFPLEGIV